MHFQVKEVIEFIPYPGHIEHPWLKQIVMLMDRFREIRLIWHATDAIIGLVTLIMVVWLILKIRKINREASGKQQEISGLVNTATKAAKKANRQLVSVEKRVNGQAA